MTRIGSAVLVVAAAVAAAALATAQRPGAYPGAPQPGQPQQPQPVPLQDPNMPVPGRRTLEQSNPGWLQWREPLNSMWVRPPQTPAFTGFPTFPYRLRGYGAYPGET